MWTALLTNVTNATLKSSSFVTYPFNSSCFVFPKYTQNRAIRYVCYMMGSVPECYNYLHFCKSQSFRAEHNGGDTNTSLEHMYTMNYTYPLQQQFVHQQLEFCRFSQGNFLYHVLSSLWIQWIVQYLVVVCVLALLTSARSLEEIFFAVDSLAGTEDT